MANFRQILIAFVAVLSLSFPSFASAQRVHEVRPASRDEVRIGAEANASLDEIVVLARRISENADLTVDDVIANNGHVRYICRVHGRQVYFGTDSTYGGARCPEDAERARGVLRHSVYRVPRMHGAHLPPASAHPSPHSVPVTDVASTARIAELERDVRERDASLENAESRIIDALNIADHASEELERIRNEPLPEQITVVRTVHEPAVALPASAPGLPWWISFLLGMAVLLIFYGLYYRRHTLAPYIAYGADRADKAKARKLALAKADTIYSDDAYRIRKLTRSRKRLAQYILDLIRTRDSQDAALGEALPQLEVLAQHQKRKADIVERNLRIVDLRGQLELPEVLRLQILECQHYLEEAQGHGDETQAEHYRMAIAQCQKQLEEIPYDPEEVREELGTLLALQREDVKLQCGLDLDGSALDEWRADMEAKTRQKLMEAEAKLRAFQAMHVILEEDRKSDQEKLAGQRAALALGNEQELAAAKRRLEEEYAAKDGELAGRFWLQASATYTASEDAKQMEKAARSVKRQLESSQLRVEEQAQQLAMFRLREAALLEREAGSATAALIMEYYRQIADLEQKLNTATGGRWSEVPAPAPSSDGSLPFDEVISMDDGPSERPPRLRRTTGALERSNYDTRVSIPGAPPLRRETSVLAELFGYLEHFSHGSNGTPSPDKLLQCNELESRDLLYFLHNFSIRTPLLPKAVPLRKFAITIEKAGKADLLATRLRRRTDPPGPPVPA